MRIYRIEDKLPLGEKQRVFTLMVAQLIHFAYREGYTLTFGDAYRDPRVFGPMGVRIPDIDTHNLQGGVTYKNYSSANSLHKLRLAVDFNLFDETGKYLTSTEDYTQIGEYWESIGGTWGGRFGDGNHFSIEHRGMK